MQSHPSGNHSEGKKLLALGDSYTIGEGVAENERFPWLTVSLLKNKGIIFAEPVYVAKTGWTTVNLQLAMNVRNPDGPFDIVTLLIGVNDQYDGLDTAGYRERFTELLEKAILLSGGRTQGVFVLSIPDYSATPFVPGSEKERVSKEIGVLNRINKEITLQYKAGYVDITPLTRDVAEDSSLLAGDQLHYSLKEYLKWAQQLALSIENSIE